MLDLLGRAQQPVLESFAHSNVLLAFDYDGTLAPIVALPERARLRHATHGLLEALAGLYPVVVISGRAQTDIVRRLRGIPLAGIVGNHGSEGWHTAAGRLVEVRRWLPAFEAVVGHIPGVSVEDKSFSIAVHYRRSREKKKARAAILAAAATLPGVRIIRGKQVVNILPRHAPHKGMALERERERLRCDTAIYVGDDSADEDVFALDQPGRLLSVRVGYNRSSAASYAIASQGAIDDLLRALVTYGRARRVRREGLG